MLKNYLVVAVRQLVKNGRYTAINVVGLAVALAACIVAYLNYDFSYGFDAFHQKADRIYRVNSTRIVNDNVQQWGLTPRPLGPTLHAAFPFVERFVRIARAGAVVRHGDVVLNETVQFADPAFFDVFTFPLAQGTPDVLDDPGKVVVSKALAVRYFGQDDPMGRQLTLRLGDEARAFTVGAVVEEIPKNSSIQFNLLTAYDNLRALGEDLNDWGGWSQVTFIEVADPAPLATLSERLTPYVELQNAARPDWEIERFYFVPLPEMFLTSEATRAYVLVESLHPAAIVSPTIIAVLLLLMACFNFMNTAVAFAGRRLKEIGIRKVVGGLRRQLIGQFMGESMLLCTLAFVLALVLAEVFAPAYSSLWPYLDLQINYADNAPLLGFLAVLLLLTGLIAGGYPALYVSSFRPVQILKGRQQLAGLNTFTRVLLTFQLTTAALVILGSLVFTDNARYQETVDLGYDKDLVLVVPLGQAARFTPYRDALRGHPSVLRVAGSRSHVGASSTGTVVRTQPSDGREAVQGEVEMYVVGEAYVETMGLRVVAGRAFDPASEADAERAVLVNETLVRAFGWDAPLGQPIEIDSVRYEVVGVLADFYEDSLWDQVEPCLLRLGPPEAYRFLTARVRADDVPTADALLRATWQTLVPEEPYAGYPQDEVLFEAMLINRSIKTVFYYISLIAVLIAAAGLYALVSLTIARRTKEIGIRKVLGASALSISRLINKPFAVMLATAAGLASAAGYFTLGTMLDSIWAYHAGVGVLPFVLATALIFVIAALTVGRQVYKIATANPVTALRYE